MCKELEGVCKGVQGQGWVCKGGRGVQGGTGVQGWEGYVRMGKGCVRCVRRGEVQGGGGGMEGERECVRGGGVCKRGRKRIARTEPWEGQCHTMAGLGPSCSVLSQLYGAIASGDKGGPVKSHPHLHHCSATASEGWQKYSC